MTDQITNAINNLGEVITGEKINGSTIKDAINEISEKYVAPAPENGTLCVHLTMDPDTDDYVADVTCDDIEQALGEGKFVYMEEKWDTGMRRYSFFGAYMYENGKKDFHFCRIDNSNGDGRDVYFTVIRIGQEGVSDWSCRIYSDK